MVRVAVIVFETNLSYFLSDDDLVTNLHTFLSSEKPDVFIALHSELNYINRRDFNDCRSVLKSFFKHGVVLKSDRSLGAVIGSQIQIHDKKILSCEKGTAMSLMLTDSEVVICTADALENIGFGEHEGSRLVCIVSPEILSETEGTLAKNGYVSIAPISAENFSTVNFFLKPAPRGCEAMKVNFSCDGSLVASIAEFT